MLNLIMSLSLLEFWNWHPEYTPTEIENMRNCVVMTKELDHTWCSLGGNYYGSEDKKYFVYDERCAFTGRNIKMYERRYIVTDLEECKYQRFRDSGFFNF